MMCRDEKDIEELNEIYGPLCWQGYDHDPGDFKQLMWYGILKEFNCKNHVYEVKEWKGKSNDLYARTTRTKRSKKVHRSWTTSSDQEEEMTTCTHAMMSERGQRGTITYMCQDTGRGEY